MATALGIDVGGSGIKGAPVDLENGTLTTDRFKVLTPKPATPQACAEVIGQVIQHFDPDPQTAIGLTVPAPVVHGHIPFMANLDSSWVGLDADSFFSERFGRPITLINDADAAGVAEMAFGAGRDHAGLVVMTTLGTGIGTALFQDGVLVPNTEFGHIQIDGRSAEKGASAGYRERKGLGYRRWSKRLQTYYATLEKLLWPDLFIVGGGISRKHDKFLPLLELRTPIVPAALRNEAGIIGAAMAARLPVAEN